MSTAWLSGQEGTQRRGRVYLSAKGHMGVVTRERERMTRMPARDIGTQQRPVVAAPLLPAGLPEFMKLVAEPNRLRILCAGW